MSNFETRKVKVNKCFSFRHKLTDRSYRRKVEYLHLSSLPERKWDFISSNVTGILRLKIHYVSEKKKTMNRALSECPFQG